MRQLTFVFREGCHLCEEMAAALEVFVVEYNIALLRVDVDQDSGLQSRFNADVPLLMEGDVVICRHFFDLAALQAHLEAL